MTVKELHNQIALRKMELEKAVASGKPTNKERARLENLLVQNVHTILEAIDGSVDSAEVEALKTKIEDLEEENEVLQDELAKADAAVKALKLELKQKETAEGGTKSGGKK